MSITRSAHGEAASWVTVLAQSVVTRCTALGAQPAGRSPGEAGHRGQPGPVSRTERAYTVGGQGLAEDGDRVVPADRRGGLLHRQRQLRRRDLVEAPRAELARDDRLVRQPVRP